MTRGDDPLEWIVVGVIAQKTIERNEEIKVDYAALHQSVEYEGVKGETGCVWMGGIDTDRMDTTFLNQKVSPLMCLWFWYF